MFDIENGNGVGISDFNYHETDFDNDYIDTDNDVDYDDTYSLTGCPGKQSEIFYHHCLI